MVLIMTGTIDSGYFGNTATMVSNTETRLNQYVYAIEKYIKESNFDWIIFAENSGYPFDADKYRRMAEEIGKQFDFLPIKTDVGKTKLFGKSYGEATLISAAVDFIGDRAPVFYKVTGRVFVKNINRLINNEISNECICHNLYEAFLTVFFKMRTDTFRKCLMYAEDEINEYQNWNCIEHIYYIKLKDEHIRRFQCYPDLSGITGMNGKPYNRSRAQMFVKNVLLKLGYYSYGKKIPIAFRTLEIIETTVAKILK